MARGTLAQQGTQIAGLATAIVVTTALGRNLTLAEFGVYGLVISFTTYLYFALGSAETAAVRSISAADEGAERDRAFSTALAVYAALGVVAGVLIAGGGVLVVGLLGFEGELLQDARLGAIGVGAVTAVGWPLKISQDLLRAVQRFATASLVEAVGTTLLAATTVVLLLVADAPLWVLITVGGAIPLYVGATATLVVLFSGIAQRPRPRELRRAELREFLRVSSALLLVAASDVVVTSLDRIILASFRSPATLGLYEGAVRPNNLVRALSGAFSVTLLPVSSRLASTADAARERALLLRGTRYMLAGLVPPTVAIMVLVEPVLVAWLGEKYGESALACAIFLVWWLFAPNAAVASTMLVVDGRLRRFAVLSWATAGANLALSLALTPIFGLEGVVLGTTLAYLVVLPFYVSYALQRVGVSLAEFARAAWLPAYGTGLVVAAGGAAAHLLLPLESPAVAFAALGGLTVLGWLLVAGVFLSKDERSLLRTLASRGS